jgi:hypothetical protein
MMPNPEDVLSQRDPGDDMQRRLRYQAAYGALLCLELMDETDCAQVFCEHHEDFLIKKTSGKYTGIQVKTRETHLGPFRSNDPAMVSALTRFVELDLEFPERFESFVVAANCDFLDIGEAETNLPHVLRLLHARPNVAFSGAMVTIIDGIKGTLRCAKKRIREVLSRVSLQGTLPTFEDITMNVATKIGQSPAYKQRTLPDLFACAQALIDYVQRSAALTCDLPIRTHFILSSNPEEQRVQSIVQHKLLTQTIIIRLLGESLSALPALQMSQTRDAINMPVGHHLLEKKMALGGISYPSIETAKDLQASTEYLLQTWIHTIGDAAAKERFEHLDVLVRSRCAEAHDEVYSDQHPFGTQMLIQLREKLRLLVAENHNTYGVSYEHLLGFASIATQECRTWWSDRVDLSGAA